MAETAGTGYICLMCPVHAWCLWGLQGVSKALHPTVMRFYIWNWSLVNISVDWAEKYQMLVNVTSIHHWFTQLQVISPIQNNQIAVGLVYCSSCWCWYFSRGLRRRQHSTIASIEHHTTPTYILELESCSVYLHRLNVSQNGRLFFLQFLLVLSYRSLQKKYDAFP